MASLSPSDIGHQAQFLLVEFLRERLQRIGMGTEIPGETLPPNLQHATEIGLSLRTIADELDGNYELNALISKVSPDDPRNTFLQVAREIFSDGIYNWGRIVTLFYFAFKLIVRAASNIGSNIVRDVISWVVGFIVDTVAQWIIERGGWESIQEYFGATSLQIGAVAVAAVVVCAFIYWRNS